MGMENIEFKNRLSRRHFNACKNTSHSLNTLETIIEEESPHISDDNLLKRLTALEEEYNELVIYTRDEGNILAETDKKVQELEEQLRTAQETICRLQTEGKKHEAREQELCDKISILEKQLKSKKDIIDSPYILAQLFQLRDILSCSSELERNCTNLKEDLLLINQVENLKKDKELCEQKVEKMSVELAGRNDAMNKVMQQIQECRYRAITNEKENVDKKVTCCCQEKVQLSVTNRYLHEEVDKTKENDKLQTEISAIVKHQSTINTLEEKLKLNELKVQRQKQLLNSAHIQIGNLRASLAEKERLISNDIISENHLMHFSTCNVRTELSTLKEQISNTLCVIINYFLNEQKALLLVRHTQDTRKRFRSVVKKIKSDNTHLKKLLIEVQSQNCDLGKISDVFINTSSNFKEYHCLEKQLMNQQIEQLEMSNKAYLYEIMTLKDLQYDPKKYVCLQCA